LQHERELAERLGEGIKQLRATTNPKAEGPEEKRA
jgi:hypothetical protein